MDHTPGARAGARGVADEAETAHLLFGDPGAAIWDRWRKGDTIQETAGPFDRFHSSMLILAETGGIRPLVARCQLGLGKLHGRSGQRQQGRKSLAVAATMFREMRMRFWLEPAERV